MNLLAKKEPRAATPAAPRREIVPRYGIEETADAFVVTAFVPGVNRSELETQVDGETLTVFARRTWTPPSEWTAVYREIPLTDYRLVLELDHRVNREAVRAELNQGVLTLTLPKAEAVKPRRIEIKG
ncbi:MAG: Hsp20/alpha crystallin family protein [Methylacidiphilales bacterium]|nr:Hsp20/alpha crystallin family protein [Candidatus Methylacidiphilales bacterium]